MTGIKLTFLSQRLRLTFARKFGQVAKLVERSFPYPEVRSSNPVISKIYIDCLLSLISLTQPIRMLQMSVV